MDAPLLLSEYFIWHYGRSMRDFFSIWGNVLWFGYHFFSMKLLVRTLFAPFKRFHQEYDLTHLDLGTLGQDMLLNLFMRLLGIIPRLGVLVAGLVFEGIVLAVGLLFFAVWLLLPVLVPFLALQVVFLLLG